MAPLVIAIFLSLGTAVWVYSKLYNKTGGNNKSSITASVVVGGVIFVVSWFIFAQFV